MANYVPKLTDAFDSIRANALTETGERSTDRAETNERSRQFLPNLAKRVGSLLTAPLAVANERARRS